MKDCVEEEASNLDIRHIKMSSGTEIIAIVNDQEDDRYILDSAYKLIKIGDTDGTFYFDFEEYFPVNKEDHCVVYKSHIEASCQVKDDMKGNYLNAIISQAVSIMDTDYTLPISDTIH